MAIAVATRRAPWLSTRSHRAGTVAIRQEQTADTGRAYGSHAKRGYRGGLSGSDRSSDGAGRLAGPTPTGTIGETSSNLT